MLTELDSDTGLPNWFQKTDLYGHDLAFTHEQADLQHICVHHGGDAAGHAVAGHKSPGEDDDQR